MASIDYQQADNRVTLWVSSKARDLESQTLFWNQEITLRPFVRYGHFSNIDSTLKFRGWTKFDVILDHNVLISLHFP